MEKLYTWTLVSPFFKREWSLWTRSTFLFNFIWISIWMLRCIKIGGYNLRIKFPLTFSCQAKAEQRIGKDFSVSMNNFSATKNDLNSLRAISSALTTSITIQEFHISYVWHFLNKVLEENYQFFRRGFVYLLFYISHICMHSKKINVAIFKFLLFM